VDTGAVTSKINPACAGKPADLGFGGEFAAAEIRLRNSSQPARPAPRMIASVLRKPPMPSNIAAAATAITPSLTPTTALRLMFQAATTIIAVTAGRNPMNSLLTAAPDQRK
jgi:hypothetical protein